MLVRRSNEPWAEARALRFAAETELQALVNETFEQILRAQSDAPAVIAREVAMPDRGRIDVLAVDAEALITVCECKLGSNPSSRREVVGQVLEYAGWLNSLSVGQLRATIEARIGGDLVEAMAQRAGEEWDQTNWLYEVDHVLRSGEFRLLIAVDEITETLKQTVRYLNEHSEPAVMAVEMRRGSLDDVEILTPGFVGVDDVQRKVLTPSRGPSVENADAVIVAATAALPEYERLGAYICQPHRSFRPETKYFGFYTQREIAPMFPKLVTRREAVNYTPEAVAQLRGSGDPEDAGVARVLEKALAQKDDQRTDGAEYQIVVLDPEAGFSLPHPIRHEHGGAWTQGQRYTSSEALKTHPETTEALHAAGG